MIHNPIDDLITSFIEVHAAWDDKTRLWYIARLRWLSGFATERGLNQPSALTGAELNHFQAHLKRASLGNSTVRATLKAVKRWLTWLRRKRIIQHDPFEDPDFQRPRRARRAIEVLDTSLAYRLIAAAEKSDTIQGARDAAVMRLLLTTGVRRAEVVDLHLNWLNLETAVLFVRGKFEHERWIPLKPTAKTALANWLAVRPKTKDPHLFVSLHPNKRGLYHGLRPDALNDALVYWRDQLGLTGSVSPHKWRRLFASQVALAGNTFGLQTLMGHSDISTTQEYVSTPSAELRRLIDEFAPDTPDEEESDEKDTDI